MYKIGNIVDLSNEFRKFSHGKYAMDEKELWEAWVQYRDTKFPKSEWKRVSENKFNDAYNTLVKYA